MANVRSSYRRRLPGLFVGFGLVASTLLLSGGCVATDAPTTIVRLDLGHPGESAVSGLAAGDNVLDGRRTLRVATLGAGDRLGMTIRMNDIVLAAARRLDPDDPAALVEAPLED